MLIGYAMCGSFCTFARSFAVMEQLAKKHELVPIFSEIAASADTRFGNGADFIARAEAICGRPAIRTVTNAEPLGPKTVLDVLITAPMTGNTLAKLAHGITDSAVTMACKAHLRADRPLLIALASNDAMSANLANIGALLQRKSVYFVPMKQDDPASKPHSLVAEFSRIPEALDALLIQKQLRPLFL
jgi:dipicolinate synthase subunit B